MDLDWNTKKDDLDGNDKLGVVLNIQKETLVQDLTDVKLKMDDSKVVNNNLNVNTTHLTMSEDSFRFKVKDISKDSSLANLNLVVKEVDNIGIIPMKLKICSSPCEKEFKEMVTRQLSLLDISTKALDPWEDKNLLEFIKTGRHRNGVSKKQMGRIEGLARIYSFSDNILLC